MNRILIIEDDTVIRDELITLFKGNGYIVSYIADFKKIIDEIKENDPHLILLDINLPIEDGFKVCSKIRSFSNVPIIFVTSRNTDMDELNSIMLGGDAFITKPYNISILLARVSSLLKRTYHSDQSEILSYGNVSLYLDSGKLMYQGKSVELTKNELKILFYLFKHAGKIVARTDIVEYLWDNQLYIDDNTLSVNITRIREKLGKVGLIDFVTTKHRQGYMI